MIWSGNLYQKFHTKAGKLKHKDRQNIRISILRPLRFFLILLCLPTAGRREILAMNENELSYRIIGLALQLHKNVGPGLLESTYENALAYDLREAGLEVKQSGLVAFFN